MTLMYKTKIKETGGKVAWLKTRGTKQYLELNWYPKGYKYGGKSGLDHLAFEVGNATKSYRDLSKRHKAPIAPFDEGLWKLAYIEDPDGNWIELGSRLPKKKR